MNIKLFRSIAFLICLLCAANVSAAVTENSGFAASFTIDGTNLDDPFNSFTLDPVGGTALTPGDCDPFGSTDGCDAFSEQPLPDRDGDGFDEDGNFSINFVDEDSFDFQTTGARNLFLDEIVVLSFTLSDFEFTAAGGGSIDGVLFNRGASDVDEYLASEDNPSGDDFFEEPTLTFTENSITAEFSSFSGQLLGDGPVFRFDISVEPVAPVPLPAAAWLLATAFAGLGALKRYTR